MSTLPDYIAHNLNYLCETETFGVESADKIVCKKPDAKIMRVLHALVGENVLGGEALSLLRLNEGGPLAIHKHMVHVARLEDAVLTEPMRKKTIADSLSDLNKAIETDCDSKFTFDGQILLAPFDDKPDALDNMLRMQNTLRHLSNKKAISGFAVERTDDGAVMTIYRTDPKKLDDHNLWFCTTNLLELRRVMGHAPLSLCTLGG